MIQSNLVNDILDLLLDGDDGSAVRHQKDFLTEDVYNYTGVGCFLSFRHEQGIVRYKSMNEKLVLSGVVIRSKELTVEAEATLFFKNGLADYLEIYSRDGVYPQKELETYTITQEWAGSPGRQITVE